MEKQRLVIGSDGANKQWYAYCRDFKFKKPCGKMEFERFYFKASMNELTREQALEEANKRLFTGELQNKRGTLFKVGDVISFIKNPEPTVEIEEPKTEENMNTKQTIIADSKCKETQELMNNFVDGSLSYNFSTYVTGELIRLHHDSQTPFVIKDSAGKLWEFTFIKKGSEPLKPYCLADKIVRAKLIGKVFMSKTGTMTQIVARIENSDGSWKINGCLSASALLNGYVWIDRDGNESPCGGDI